MIRRQQAIFFLVAAISLAATDKLSAAAGNPRHAKLRDLVWQQAREEQELIRKRGNLLDDPQLRSYLEAIGQKLYPQLAESDFEFSVQIVKDPTFNAFAYPNGAVYFHTGLLAALENEAQVATILAHEITHFLHGHSVESYRKLKNKTAWFTTFARAADASGASYGAIVGSIALQASVSGHSRHLERDADESGVSALVRAGYSPYEASKAYQHLQTFIEEETIKEPFFFGSHPKLRERLLNVETILTKHLANETTPSGKIGEADYFDHTRSLLLANARLDLGRNDFARAERAIDRFERLGQTNAQSCFLRGEIHRLRADESDVGRALESYRKGLSIEHNHADLNRAIGTLYFHDKEWEAALPHLALALSHHPDHPRAGFIIHYIEECKRHLDSTKSPSP